MRLKILAFGIAKDICGVRSFELEMPENSDIESLKKLLFEQYPPLQQLVSCLFACNEDYAHENTLLSDGDEIAILPPVSGG